MGKELTLDWQSIDYDDPWLRVGEATQSSSQMGSLDGKYLFFSRNQNLLMRLIEREIKEHGFQVAKVIAEAEPFQDYVACLYWTDGTRNAELAPRYKNFPGVKYRGYKTNEATRQGIYSKQYLEGRG